MQNIEYVTLIIHKCQKLLTKQITLFIFMFVVQTRDAGVQCTHSLICTSILGALFYTCIADIQTFPEEGKIW